MDRLFALFCVLFFSFSAGAQVENMNDLITQGYAQQADSYEKMEMHPRSLAILKSLSKTSKSKKKIKVRLVPRKVMIANSNQN